MEPNNFEDMLTGISEEHKIISAYAFQAKMYILTNQEVIKKKYASWIFDELKIPPMTSSIGVEPIEHLGVTLIKHFVELYDNLLILYNPETKKPSIIDSAYAFSEYDVPAFEEKILLEYANSRKNDGSGGSNEIVDIVKNRAIKMGAGLTLMKAGSHLSRKAILWSSKANNYSAVHSYMMKNKRIFQSTRSQQKALNTMMGNIEKLGSKSKYATKSTKLLGFISTKLIKSAIKGPIGIFDAFTPAVSNAPNRPNYEDEIFKERVLKELKKYCINNSNFDAVINQQYFEQR